MELSAKQSSPDQTFKIIPNLILTLGHEKQNDEELFKMDKELMQDTIHMF